ncbi:MAG: NADH-quinone oxidoreductase subunit L [Myxococcota bacterium]
MQNLPVLWIVLLPLAGAIMNGLAGRFANKRLVSLVGVGTVLGAFGLAVSSFLTLQEAKHDGMENAALVADVYEWFTISLPGIDGFREVPIRVRFVFDSLSGLMTLVVTGIGSLIHIYSLGYMKDDPGYARFFAYLNLFMASMLILVLASSVPLMFVGWEGVGLCSYLLIGFWWHEPAYAAAGRKAFIANRIGDFGVLIGMFILVSVAGSFEFTEINSAAPELQREMTIGAAEVGTMATVACLFLFLGCTGKSAQVPLYVWLPDAMAGPTPVSALIHAATMVTAGVYLCCRLSPVFLESPTAMSVIAIVGAVTAFIAATIAVVQHEMKKILAYSTVSQLGFMFAAVGVGAFAAGFFHVFTHAFFKACLFLGAGSVMHAVHAHGDADIYKLGGMKKFMPKTHWTFLVSCLAIAGVPFFSGFFSKDEILLGASNVAFGGEASPISPGVGWFVLVTLFIAATMTAFYMFRLYYLTFTGEYRSAGGDDHDEAHGDGHDDHHHSYPSEPHESETAMTFPLMVLGIGAVVVGFLGIPHVLPFAGIHLDQYHWWGHWMDPSITNLALGENMTAVNVAAVAGLLAMAIGILAARALYKDAAIHDTSEDRLTLPEKLRAFLFDKWRVDEFYGATILMANKKLAVFAGRIDQTFVDGLLTKATSGLVAVTSWVFTRIQVGVVHAYGLVLVLGLVGMSWWFLYPHADVKVEATTNSASFQVGRGFGYEYRFDVDGDGEFDIPVQPQHVTIDLKDDITNEEAARVVALVRAAIAPEPWPSDRSALGTLTNAGGKVYEFHPPESEIGDLREALEGAQNIEHVHFASVPGQTRFGSTTRAQYRYSEEDRTGYMLLVNERRGQYTEIALETSPLLLNDGIVGPGWQASSESETPAAAFLDEDGHVVIRPNDAVVRQANQQRDEEFWLEPGQRIQVGRTTLAVAPVIEATVEVRNAFGNIDRETVSVTLVNPPRQAAPAQAANRATPSQARAEVIR